MSPAFGIILGLLGNISINTGNNLQSLGMHQMESEHENYKLCNSRTWVIGTVIFVLGALVNFASYGFAPQSTLASLGSIQFVTNLFFGKLLLGKHITNTMMLGTALTVGGTVLAVMFSSKEYAEVNAVNDLIKLWNNTFWIGYIVIIWALVLALQWGYKKLEQKQEVKDFENIMAAIYAIISSLFGTLSVVFAKLLARLLQFQADGINIFAEWYTYVTLFSWLVLMAFWLYRLNAALGLYNPLIIIPLLQANFILYAVISGGIYFQEFNYMTLRKWLGFTVGIFCMFSGIYLLIPPDEQTDMSTELLDVGLKTSVRNILKTTPTVLLVTVPTTPTVLLVTVPSRMNDWHYDREVRLMTSKTHLELSPKKVVSPSKIVELVSKLPDSMWGVKSINYEEQKLLEANGCKKNDEDQNQTSSQQLTADAKESDTRYNMEQLEKESLVRHLTSDHKEASPPSR